LSLLVLPIHPTLLLLLSQASSKVGWPALGILMLLVLHTYHLKLS